MVIAERSIVAHIDLGYLQLVFWLELSMNTRGCYHKIDMFDYNKTHNYKARNNYQTI
jgi:hypothetical protein